MSTDLGDADSDSCRIASGMLLWLDGVATGRDVGTGSSKRSNTTVFGSSAGAARPENGSGLPTEP